MSEFHDRLREILNNGKSISVELPNDDFLLDILVDIEDNKYNTVCIKYNQNYSRLSFNDRIRYCKMDAKQNHIDKSFFSESSQIHTTIFTKIKQFECDIICSIKTLVVTSVDNCESYIDTILDYLGVDLIEYLDWKRYEGVSPKYFKSITYKSYIVNEKEIYG